MYLNNLVICSYQRTAFGKFGGALKGINEVELAFQASQSALKASKIAPEEISSVVGANVVQSSSNAIYLSRHVGLRLGLPQESSALNINRLCGSGFEAFAQAAYRILVEKENAVLLFGTESMSCVPFVLRNARWGHKLGNTQASDYLMESLHDEYAQLPMALTAENLCDQYSLSREEVDAVALRSQQRTEAAFEKGIFKDEICPLTLKQRKKEILFDRDEHPRAGTQMEDLAKLKTLFRSDGVVTAGNASGMVDGAAAAVLCSEEFAKSRSLPVLAHLRGWASVGCDPKIMGIGPVPATKLLLSKMKDSGKSLSISDFKAIEINEAFAPQYLAVERELELDPEKTNVNGGAIAIGHPLAATGTRLVGHLALELRRRGGGLGLASACIGGGQGMSLVLEVAS